MSEQVEIWQAMSEINKVESREKKQRNRQSSSAILTKNKIPFVSKNNGLHIIIQNETNTFAICDFWPSTGKYQFRRPFLRGISAEGRGVFNLLKELKKQNNRVVTGFDPASKKGDPSCKITGIQNGDHLTITKVEYGGAA